jgi:4-amino-4-deoxy-L-arabinose transferase-like glycosyltransferase
MKKKGITFIFLIIYLCLFSFNTISSPFQRDEGEYAYSAKLLSSGSVPYKEAFMQKPPMIIYTYYLAQIFSEKTFAPRILEILFLAITILLMADIAKKQFGENVLKLFVLLFPIVLFFPWFQASAAQPEIFLLLPMALSWWCYFKAEQTPAATSHLF